MATFEKKYNPNRSAEWNYGGEKWKLSRSKIDLFIECPRCFYLDNKLGTKRPGFPAFNLNLAVDELFKKEFDSYRSAGKPHPIMQQYGIEAVPFVHPQLDEWRENFVGITYFEPTTKLTISGAVDDIWVKADGTLIIVDYKSTSKDERIEALGDSPWEKQYARQLGVYRWLLTMNGFSVNATGYLVYANASRKPDTFADRLTFETTLVSCETETDWILDTLVSIKACLDHEAIPPSGSACEYCPYREASGKKLLALHTKLKKA